ncbi:MAG: hypothetical protein RL660_394 [Bacteroidota bacterium]|jgi:hypothetical protein
MKERLQIFKQLIYQFTLTYEQQRLCYEDFVYVPEEIFEDLYEEVFQYSELLLRNNCIGTEAYTAAKDLEKDIDDFLRGKDEIMPSTLTGNPDFDNLQAKAKLLLSILSPEAHSE